LKMLERDFGVPRDMMDPGARSVRIAPWILQEIAPDIIEEAFISECYPTVDGLEVERIPL
jgi:pyruvate formate-lyase activating enzyme-like uncharacterized protein